VAQPPPAPADSTTALLERLAGQNDQILAQQSDIVARLEVVEKGGIRFIESEEPPKPVMREANPESLSDFSRRLLARTHDMPEGGVIAHEPAYNVGLRWYLRRDGDYVQLQGDAKNRAMYEDLGFYLLTPEEAADYVKNERPGILREQQRRATLINGLRRLAHENNELSGYDDNMDWYVELEDKSIPALEEEWHKLCRQTSTPNRALPVARRRREDQEPPLGGVETTASREDLLRKMSAPGAMTRTIEVTRENAHMFS
jgi:hypothetical protein